MKIGIDGCSLIGNRTGVGRYVFELCRALDHYLPFATFYIYSPLPFEMPVNSKRWVARIESSKVASKFKKIIWLKTRAGNLCRADNLDAFWGGGTFLPNLATSVYTVSTVHDLNYLLVPETMYVATYWTYRIFFKSDIKRANKILANSQGTADRLYKHLGLSVNGIVLPAVSLDFRRPSNQVIKSTLARLGLIKPYFLAVATLEPRKNLEMLVNVFANLNKQGQLINHELILVGGKGWKDRRLMSLFGQYASIGVRPIGFVENNDLPSLYAGADAFIFPSIYEGFGMPVLEARACGARVLASDIPEIREAGGSESMYIQPNENDLFLALPQLLKQENNFNFPVQTFLSWDDGAKILAHTLTRGVLDEDYSIYS